MGAIQLIAIVLVIWCWGRVDCIDCYQCYSTELRDPCTGAFGRPPQEFAAHAKSKFCDGGTTMDPGGVVVRMATTVFGQDMDPFCVINVWRARGRHSWIVKRGCFSARFPYPPLMSTLITLRSNDTNATRTELRCTVDKLEHGESITCICRTDNCNTAPLTMHVANSSILAASLIIVVFLWLSPFVSVPPLRCNTWKTSKIVCKQKQFKRSPPTFHQLSNSATNIWIPCTGAIILGKLQLLYVSTFIEKKNI